ncbi:MAG: glycosyl transferase, partial [Deltaproteobacteria bacterium]|nr:glycosyl transferase [Deltaproteobacteria bacterium]
DHSRRRLFKEHLKQISNYALHRGFFVKKFPKTSLRLGYFIPSIFLLYLILFPVWVMYYPVVLVPLVLYTVLLCLTMIHIIYNHKNIGLSVLTAMGIFLTHVFYGYYFLNGITARRLEK